MDKVLTIIPIYNKEKFLEGAIESVLQQTHKNIELVLVDDCSTDKSLEIAKSYEHLDNVTVLQNPKNRGCYYTRNKGLDSFKDKEWDYFTIHDADDISDITRFEVILKSFQSVPNSLGMKTTYVRVTEDLSFHVTKEGSYDIYSSEGIAFFPRKTFELLGYYDNIQAGGDTDYWERCRAYCKVNPEFKTSIHRGQLYFAVLHGDNLTIRFPISTRHSYFNRIGTEIQEMASKNNFYRDIFK